MHIKELVLDNFKSFGRKTRIPFYEDFTVVTGPNGSGKSNIIDSILFALGLARTSGIRAEKLTDLIYNPGHADEETDGSGEREASVEVILANEDRTLDRSQVINAAGTEDVGDVDEISIKRRVKETEDNYYSYYYINGRSVNLGDIQDLLAQAGVAPEGYNVVMQGDVTEIINMTAGSRREIIDEIAGVAQFDEQKADAFEELEVVQERIDEAELRIEEKRERLDQLADERETALQYQELREEKAEYEGYRKAAELEDKREERAEIREEIGALEDELADLQRELDERQGAVVRLEDELQSLNTEIERKGEDEQLAIKREIEEIKGDISRLEDSAATAEEKVEDAENERRQAFVQIDRKQETIDDLESEIRQTKVEKSNVKAEINEREAELADVQAKIDAVGEEFEEVKSELEAKRTALEAAKSAKNDHQREQDRLLDDARRRSNQQREKRDAIEDAEAEIPDIEADIEDLETELEKAQKNSATITEVVEDLTAEKRELQSDVDELEDEISGLQQEYANLEAKAGQDGDSSYGRAVTTILNAGMDGVHGTVGQLGGVDPDYATACETAAGGRLAHVVVDDDTVGQRGIEYLKSRNAGRATFLPITEMHQRSLPSLPQHGGVVDFAYNLVDFDPEYAGIFSYVLGDTVVVADMDTAREFMGEFRMVTLEGDLVETSGAMTGGSSSGTRYSFSGGQGQLERVAAKINELEDERQERREELRDVEARLDDARDRQTDANDQVREIESEIERKRAAIEDAHDRVERLEAELAEIEAEREDVSDEMDVLEGKIARQNEAIAIIEADIDELEAEVADSQLPALTDEADRIKQAIDELESRESDLDADLNELQLEKQYAEDNIEELHEDIEAAQNRKAEAEERIAELEAEIEEKRSQKAAKEDEVAELEAELADLKSEREELREELQDAKERRDEQQSKVSELERDLDDATEERERLDWEIDELEAEVGDYDPDEIPDHHVVESQIGRLESRMEELEPVNMRAIDEYDAVEADLDELEDKKETLVEEADGIRDRIETYEQRKKATFMDAFDEINEQFEDIFERLSNGTGHLHLEDEADPFEGGLTMKAQPGDKPIQRLNAMSGGEKSLTALAFIFAIQRHNPAPFYALDEVDAFLDAANAELVGEMVDELAGDAQFVVVSHRSALLDRSERAIGVTMQDDNVSAVTGIDLTGEIGEVPADD
ncbi:MULTISPECIES: chromosome segregation protein SMC [Halomicrobium]|uniref:Chromosome partition protein Smc n=2 Tax=Halomicrobium mukohataei TaxID=57705 RepID=C7P1L7_HALMD|nr:MULTISPECIES: chromosome segregation protein SMC [Halomicrobium]ACV49107.1 chromosome segregation protein SMC [Halomicrobium mukohataei DSM 12286]QCD64521.1 chromosome segregation protein SMC [Halomicrobium mukohataei]QFR19327.1 chromosome segregation protein SMC [Halomicrobium sp. ZPS1]